MITSAVCFSLLTASGRTAPSRGETVVVEQGITAGADSADVPCFRGEPIWKTPPEFLLASPLTALGAFGILIDAELEGRIRGATESSMRRWLSLDDVTVNSSGIRVQKAYGDRLTVRSTAGIGAAAEEGVEANYRLWRAWYLRSEARERGETVMELRRELHFW